MGNLEPLSVVVDDFVLHIDHDHDHFTLNESSEFERSWEKCHQWLAENEHQQQRLRSWQQSSHDETQRINGAQEIRNHLEEQAESRKKPEVESLETDRGFGINIACSSTPSASIEEVQVKWSRNKSQKQTVDLIVSATYQIVTNIPRDETVHATASVETEVRSWESSDNKKGRSSLAQVSLENNRDTQFVPTTSEQSPRFYPPSRSEGIMRPHAFCQKTVIKPETCEPCRMRIKFSKEALICRKCKATCHPECKDMIPIPCVPIGSLSSMNHLGTLEHPMIPVLIQHFSFPLTSSQA